MNAIAPIAAAAPPDPPGDRARSPAARLDAEMEAMEARVRAARRARLLGLETERPEVAARAAEAEAKRVDARARLVCQAVEDTVKLDILRRNGEDASALDGEAIEYDEPEEDEIDEAIWAAERLLLKGKAYAGFADQPVSAVVAQVCADLGLTPDWSVWADEDWAIEEAEALPGSPFAGPAPLETGPRETGRRECWYAKGNHKGTKDTKVARPTMVRGALARGALARGG